MVSIESPERRTRRVPKRRRRWIWTVAGVLLLFIAIGAWIGVRGYLAQRELTAAQPLVSRFASQVVSGDQAGAVKSASSFTGHATAASDLTGDPVWRAAEIVPWLGPNLAVFRQLTEEAATLSATVVQPLAGMTGDVKLSGLKPVNGQIDLEPIIAAQKTLGSASSAMSESSDRISGLKVDGVVPQLRDAYTRVASAAAEAASGLAAVSQAAELMPSMMGSTEPRTYLVLFQNNAELRSTGGIPGAMVLVGAQNGQISLVKQASTSDFPKFPQPVTELPLDTRTLYGDNTAQFMQDVTFTPDFALSAGIARDMWASRFGDSVDGVLSLDPIALSYLLQATGPIDLPTGGQLTSENAVRLLLQDTYSNFSKPRDQDAFFASVAASVFEKVVAGGADPKRLVQSLTKASDERRVLLWSSRENEQLAIEQSGMSGSLPQSSELIQNFGIYLNDSTTAKMDPYLQVSISAGQEVCRNDGLPTNSVQVTMTNIAPADAGSVLPDYVTGGGQFGIPPGNIRTNVAAYGAPGLYNMGVARDGARVAYQPASDNGYGVSKLEVELAPGETTTLDFQFLGNDLTRRQVSVQHTPFVYPIETLPLVLDCGTALQ